MYKNYFSLILYASKIWIEAQHHIDDALRVRSGPENLSLILLEGPEPVLDVARVLRDVGPGCPTQPQ
jgi:hypothetical protein